MSSSPDKPTGSASALGKAPAPKDSVKPAATSGEASGPSSEPAEIQREIERAREQLSDTVEALAYKVNLPERVKGKVHEASETFQAKADEVKQQAQATAQQVGRQMQERAEELQAKTADVRAQAKGLTDQAMAKLPPTMRERIEHVTMTAMRRPVPTGVAAVVLFVVVRRVLRGKR